jgi:hypothetical protein
VSDPFATQRLDAQVVVDFDQTVHGPDGERVAPLAAEAVA